jgi:hypothetical protein
VPVMTMGSMTMAVSMTSGMSWRVRCCPVTSVVSRMTVMRPVAPMAAVSTMLTVVTMTVRKAKDGLGRQSDDTYQEQRFIDHVCSPGSPERSFNLASLVFDTGLEIW